MRTGGIVLCGGLSSRMGQPKAWLPFGDELMLPRVVRIVREVVEPVVVVAARGQDVPPLPLEVAIIRDEVEGCGPLGGLAAGLTALSGKCEVVYLSSCDVPHLEPEFVQRVVEVLKQLTPEKEWRAKFCPSHMRGIAASGEGSVASDLTPPAPFPKEEGGARGPMTGERCGEQSDRGAVSCPSPALGGRGSAASGEGSAVADLSPPVPLPEGKGEKDEPGALAGCAFFAAVPHVAGRLHPLASAYRVSVLPQVQAMLAAKRLRLIDLFGTIPTYRIEADELTDIDPAFASLRNINTPEEYAAVLHELNRTRPT